MKTYEDIKEEMYGYVKTKNLSKLKKLIKQYPKFELLKFEYAKLLASTNNSGNLEKAKALFLKMLPYNFLALYELAKIEKANGNFLAQSNYLKEILQEEVDPLKTVFINYDLALSYIYQQRYSEALTELESILEIAPNHKGAHFNIASVLIALENYSKAYEELLKIDRYELEYDSRKRYDEIMLYLKLKLNKDVSSVISGGLTYVQKQIVSYSEERAIFHISEHLVDSVSYENTNKFNTNICIEDLLKEAKESLDKARFIKACFLDEYVLEKKEIGYEGENYLRIVTLPHTKDIITMYPCSNYFNYFPSREAKKELISSRKVRVRK